MSGRLPAIASLIGAFAAPTAVVIALLLAGPLAAETLGNGFGGLTESSKDPIDIESDVLVVHDKQKFATFSGNVKAVQGTTTLQAKELIVHYVGGDKLAPGAKKEGADQPAPATKVADAQGGEAAAKKDTQITKIEAKGDVVITSKDGQTTTSEWALYDLPAQQVTVGGNVVLTQGKNVLKGDRLVIDLKTGESRFEHTGDAAAGGRIRALFMPKDAAKGEKSDDAAPGDAKPAAAPEKEAASSKKPDAAGAGDDWPADSDPSDDVPWPLSPDKRP